MSVEFDDQGFIERWLELYHQFRQEGKKADLLVFMGRVKLATGEPLPPRLEVRLYEGEGWFTK